MTKSVFTTLLTLALATVLTFGQNGTIRGKVIDNATGETLIGVTVMIEGTTKGSATDLDGKFEVSAEPGTYNLAVSYVSYTTLRISGVSVTAGNVTLLDNIRLSEDVAELKEVVVTAEAIKVSEEALLTVKRSSANLLDGISSAGFRRIGDSDAASAVKRVPGVSVEGGKYVYVRGIGDRYTKSTLNGVDIPGLDPDRNTVQMDLFPTSLIDNIVVLKSFTSDLPADFTGGIVNLDTKSFPEEKIFRISGSLGYNPAMHFNDNYLTYTGGKTDFLGFDDGTRDIPTGRSLNFPRYVDVVGNTNSPDAQEFRSILESFNPELAAIRSKSGMDFGLSVSYGDQLIKGDNTVGYNLSLAYSNTTEYYEDAEYGRYGKDSPSTYNLVLREQQKGDYGVNNVSLSGMAGLALKTDRSKYKLNILHTQNGESKAGVFDFQGAELGSNFKAYQHNLEYSQRSLTNVFFNGVHHSVGSNWIIDWRLSPTRSVIKDPDIRFTRYRDDDGTLSIGTESGYPERIWRYLEEYNIVGKVDFMHDHQMFAKEAKVKFGGAFTFKNRDYEIQTFQIIPQNVELTGDPNELFLPENLWGTNPDGTSGTRYEPSFIPYNTNQFNSSITNGALYVSNELKASDKLKAIVGIRAEKYSQYYTGINQHRVSMSNEKVLDDLDIFPTANLIYSFTEKQNVRMSYSRTIARPSFKEASFAEILDPITGRTFVGGFFRDMDASGTVNWDGNLQSTKIDNFDLRWEVFQDKGQTIAASLFYKKFDQPIEMVQFVQSPNSFQPRNVGDGQLYGVEVELRKNLEFITSSLENFSLNSNVTFTKSQIEMSPTEYNSRKLNAREGETITNTRSMAGQAPYLINIGIMYSGLNNGVETGIFYNVQGETLTYVGIADRPDVYSVPFKSLNFNFSKSFGTDERLQLGFNVTNILDAQRKLVFKSYKANEEVFTSLNPGTSVGLKFGYKF